MNQRKLTSEQIDGLFTFVQGRGVSYYDVQMELVDHFASAIEQRWETNSELSYDEALQMEYRHFNRYEFKQIIKEKEESLSEKYQSQQKKYIQKFFKWPRILMFVAITLGAFFIFLAIDNFLAVYYLHNLASCLVLFAFKYILFPLKYRFRPETEKSFLFITHQDEIKESMNPLAHFSNLIFSSLVLFLYTDLPYTMVILSKFFLAFIFASSMLFVIAAYKYVPQRIKEDFTREFPQFVKS